MFLDSNLSEQFLDDLVQIGDEERKKLRKWFETWLSDAAIKNPGPWVESFRLRLESLISGMSFKIEQSGPVVHCKPIDNSTLTLLIRGSGWFDGVDQLNLKLWSVIITR